MGQRANGILFGCEAPELPDTFDSDEPIYDLICRWEEAKKIAWTDPGLKIRHEHEGGRDLVGIWVAVGGSGEDGAPYFLDEAIPVDQVWRVFRKPLAKAEKLWARFSTWAKKQGVDFGDPCLWLTPCETA